MLRGPLGVQPSKTFRKAEIGSGGDAKTLPAGNAGAKAVVLNGMLGTMGNGGGLIEGYLDPVAYM